MSWIQPDRVETTTGPTTDLVPISDVGLYLGGIETAGSGADQFLGAATALIDGPGSITGYAFRRRTLRLTVAVGAQRTIWLPGGLPVGTITVELDGDAYTDFETTEPFPHVRFLTVEDCGDFTIEYDVGSTGDAPDIVKVATLRAVAMLWHNREAGSMDAIVKDVRTLLADYLIKQEF